MKKVVITLLAIVTHIITSCDGNDVSERLKQIDALLTDDKVDSAEIQINQMNISDLQSSKDSAYYYLLLTEIQYRKWIPVETDIFINYSIKFYHGTSEKEKLARAYYYKGVTTYNYKKPINSILLLKQAEKQAEKQNNLLLMHKIYESLSYYNGTAHEYDLSLIYAKKALNIAKTLNDKEREAMALLYMASDYSFLGDHDSLAICVQECLPLASYLTKYERAYLYTRLGELYSINDSELAKKYLIKAIDTYPQPSTFKTLSNIYLKEDSFDRAKKMWENAIFKTKDSKASTIRIDIFKAMRQQSLERKDFLQANSLADSIIKWQQKYQNIKEQEKIAEIQAIYDKEAAEQAIRNKVLSWGLISLIFTLLIVSYLSYMSYRGLKAKKDLAETKVKLEAYTQKAAELESSGKADAKTINDLHKKINDLHHHHSGILAKGKELSEAIEAGGTTVRWSKDDFINYMEYYKLRDLPFVNEMETGYNRLSAKYIFFAILEHEGKTDEDIQHIMGISESTLRSTRSRINNKRR